MTVSEYFEQLHANKFDNLGKWTISSDTYTQKIDSTKYQ